MCHCSGSGWSGKQNGELLSLAEAAFDVLVTVDTNLRYQQNLADRRIAILLLQSSSNRLEHLRQHFPASAVIPESPMEARKASGRVRRTAPPRR